MLQAFSFSLLDQADAWLYYLPSGSITTWYEMKKLFLEKYFPASKAASIRKEISGICRLQGRFFMNIGKEQRCLIDATLGGALSEKTFSQATSLIERMASNTQQFYTRNDSNIRRVGEIGGCSQSDQRLNNIEKVVQRMAAVIIPSYEEEAEQVTVVFPNQSPSYANKQAAPLCEAKWFPTITISSSTTESNLNIDEKSNAMTQGITSLFQQNQQKTDSAIKDLQTQVGQMATEMNLLKAMVFSKLPSQSIFNAVMLRSGNQLEENQQRQIINNLDQEEEAQTDPKEKPIPSDQPKVSVLTHITPPPFPSRFVVGSKTYNNITAIAQRLTCRQWQVLRSPVTGP
ncbi:uncharacterized protein LOC113305941 [Papaver somniferum]|uniref:uncharacterized protein LOC113305941 n=1 Tax=Papaver somniferum TaxID=3469 RepID=UPI000E6F82C0|nr:uncharacterized protein LOC113305941 [Papaver somniferum]